MQPQQSHDTGSLRRGFSWVLFISRALASSLEVFLHRSGTFGDRYFGLQTAAATAIIFFYPIFWAGHDIRPLYWFLVAFLCMCVSARGSTFARKLRGGNAEHSYYTGTPRLMRQSGRISESQFKGVVEPLLVFLAGAFAAQWNEPLGAYLMLAAVGLFLSVRVTALEERQRALDLNDSMIDQRRIMERWRGMRRD